MDWLDRLIDRSPFVAIVAPASGVGATYIPDVTDAPLVDPMLALVEPFIPYIRIVLILATLVSTVLAIIIQFKKLRCKDNE